MVFIVQYSGGVGSWAAAKLLVDQHGPEQVHLLFADTLTEDEDLYRFLDETQKNLGAKLIRLEDGRDIWEVFADKRYLGNSRIDPCSRILKRDFLREYIDTHYDPDEDTVVLGIDWSEMHRLEKARPKWDPWVLRAPLCEPPYYSKDQLFEWLENEGIPPPWLYELDFAHNNCGGACVKAGQAQWKQLYRHMPDRFAYHAQKEQEMRELLDKDISILRRQRDGVRENLTLWQLKAEIDAEKDDTDPYDIGGCGCAID